MRHLFWSIFLLFFQGLMFGQTPEESSGIFIISATSQYEMQDFERALGYLQRAEDILGKSTPDLEALRVKCHFFSGDIENAKASLARFFAFEEIENGLWGEISLYIVKIDDIEQEQERKRKEDEEKLRQLIATTTFYKGLGLVQGDKNKYGYISKEGKLMIPYQFDLATTFENEFAKVTINGESGLINTQGEYVVPLQKFHRLEPIFDKNGLILYIGDNYRSGKTPYEMGFIDKGGNTYYSFDTDALDWEEADFYYWGGYHAYEQNLFLKAVKFCEMIPPSHHNYARTQAVLGDIYYYGNSELPSDKTKAMDAYDKLNDHWIQQLEPKERERIGDLLAGGSESRKIRALDFYEGLDTYDFKYIRTAIDAQSFPKAQTKLANLDPKQLGDNAVIAEVHFLNGYLLEHQGDLKNAKKAYKKIKSLEKANPKIASEATQRLEGLKKA